MGCSHEASGIKNVLMLASSYIYYLRTVGTQRAFFAKSSHCWLYEDVHRPRDRAHHALYEVLASLLQCNKVRQRQTDTAPHKLKQTQDILSHRNFSPNLGLLRWKWRKTRGRSFPLKRQETSLAFLPFRPEMWGKRRSWGLEIDVNLTVFRRVPDVKSGSFFETVL